MAQDIMKARLGIRCVSSTGADSIHGSHGVLDLKASASGRVSVDYFPLGGISPDHAYRRGLVFVHPHRRNERESRLRRRFR